MSTPSLKKIEISKLAKTKVEGKNTISNFASKQSDTEASQETKSKISNLPSSTPAVKEKSAMPKKNTKEDSKDKVIPSESTPARSGVSKADGKKTAQKQKAQEAKKGQDSKKGQESNASKKSGRKSNVENKDSKKTSAKHPEEKMTKTLAKEMVTKKASKKSAQKDLGEKKATAITSKHVADKEANELSNRTPTSAKATPKVQRKSLFGEIGSLKSSGTVVEHVKSQVEEVSAQQDRMPGLVQVKQQPEKESNGESSSVGTSNENMQHDQMPGRVNVKRPKEEGDAEPLSAAAVLKKKIKREFPTECRRSERLANMPRVFYKL